MPRARPAIPHGPLMFELRMDVQPVAFMELMYDGKPLQPTDYATSSPLSFALPCPAAGQHVLQARYLSGNIWSYYSNPLRFEVRLPQQPRIIAVSDVEHDPTPLVRNSMTSITTGSIKVHLANVRGGESIVAYVDGKPVSSQSGSEPCCRIFKVEGFITSGVHKLTVRAVGCPGACSITSRPSNEVLFHYYDERIYLLRPAAGCDNKCSRPDSAAHNSPHGAQPANLGANAERRSNSLQLPPLHVNPMPRDPAAYTFVMLTDPEDAQAAADKVEEKQTPTYDYAKDAAQLVDQATKFHELVAPIVEQVGKLADEALRHAKAADSAAAAAETSRGNAADAITMASREAKAAETLATKNLVTKNIAAPHVHMAKILATAAKDAAATGYANANAAFSKVDMAATSARARATASQTQSMAAEVARTAANEANRRSDLSLAKIRIYSEETLAHAKNVNAVGASAAIAKAAQELNNLKSALDEVNIQIVRAESNAKAADAERTLAESTSIEANQQAQIVLQVAKTLTAANAISAHLQDPSLADAGANRTAAQVASVNAEYAAQQAAESAAKVDKLASDAVSAAKMARSNATDTSRAIQAAGEAVIAARSAASDATAEFNRADNRATAELGRGNSKEARVAQRAAESARADRDAAHVSAAAAEAAYNTAAASAPHSTAAATNAELHAQAALASATKVQYHARLAADAQEHAMGAQAAAHAANEQYLAALKHSDQPVADMSQSAAASAKSEADRYALEAANHQSEAARHAAATESSANSTIAAANQAGQVAAELAKAVKAKDEAVARAASASNNATLAGQDHELRLNLEAAWENAEVAETQAQLQASVAAAAQTTQHVD
ncbi:MAG: hypothetical protein ABI614_20170, partial [Planctomycetota bacterium]